MKMVCTNAQDTTTEPRPNPTSASSPPPCSCDARTSTKPTATRLATAAVSSSRSATGRAGSSDEARASVCSASIRPTLNHTSARYTRQAASQPASNPRGTGPIELSTPAISAPKAIATVTSVRQVDHPERSIADPRPLPCGTQITPRQVGPLAAPIGILLASTIGAWLARPEPTSAPRPTGLVGGQGHLADRCA